MRTVTFHQPDIRYPQKPTEDMQYAENAAFCVADGITRDPIGITDFTGYSKEQLLEHYPVPSPAAAVAKLACKTFVQTAQHKPPQEAMLAANRAVAELNQAVACDYLEHDLAGCTVAGGIIANKSLLWASIGDCQIIVFGQNGALTFESPDGTAAWAEYEHTHNLGDWNRPEYRRLVRNQYRNNPDQVVEGQLVAYGALTGEAAAESFISAGSQAVQDDDVVVCYSDGYRHTVHHPHFLENLQQDRHRFEAWEVALAEDDYKYGRERTLMVITIN